MASVPPTRPASLATAMDLDDVMDQTTFEEALFNTEGMKIAYIDVPIVAHKPVGTSAVTDLPATENLSVNGTRKRNQWLEVVPNQQTNFDFKQLETLFLQQRYIDLLEPIKPKVDPKVPYSMQIFVLPTGVSTKTVVKHFRMANGGKVSESMMHFMAHGSAFDINFTGHFRDGPRGLQSLLENLGGFQVRYAKLVPSANARQPPKELGDIAKGFEYLRQKHEDGLQEDGLGQFIEFAELEVNNPDGPLYKWDKAVFVISAFVSIWQLFNCMHNRGAPEEGPGYPGARGGPVDPKNLPKHLGNL